LDPLDIKKLFGYGINMLKLTPPEVAANIVNTFYSDRFADERFRNDSGDSKARVRYALQPLVDEMKKQYGIEIKSYPSHKALFIGYAQDIEEQTKRHYSEIIYDVLIKGNTEKETYENFNTFFQTSRYSVAQILEMLSPEGRIDLSDQIFSLD